VVAVRHFVGRNLGQSVDMLLHHTSLRQWVSHRCWWRALAGDRM
jgi:hypothetical protein